MTLRNDSEAAEDIDLIREESRGLEERTDLDANKTLDELLYNLRYPLYMEGGHRWLDLRRYDLLERLPPEIDNAVVHGRFPIPLDECLFRGLSAKPGLFATPRIAEAFG